MRRLFHFTTAAAALLLASSALASNEDDTACWNRDVERLDFFSNPPERGDNQFFTGTSAQGSNTNVTLVYPAKASMKQFTHRMYSIRQAGTGCANTYLNGLTYFMSTNVAPPTGAAALQGTYKNSSTVSYPDPGPTYAGGGGQSDGLTPGNAYRYLTWPANGSAAGETFDTACTNAGGSSQKNACRACLDSNGYWINPVPNPTDNSTQAVFTGKFLRFHPPKWTLLSLAYKRLVNGPLLASLREAVVATNGATGGQVVQKMLPQSCQGQGRPLNQKLGAIDSLSYASSANPTAEMLFNTGWYMDGQPSSWYVASSASQTTIPGAAMANGSSGPCPGGCAGDFIVLFTDGRGDTANPRCTKNALGILPGYCNAEQQCTTVGMGTEDDGNEFLNPTWPALSSITGAGSRQSSTNTCDMDFADDVARWLNTRASPAPRIRTYVVGIGERSSPAGEMLGLDEIASAGGTQSALIADEFEDLENNIKNVLVSIISRATSFSAAAITSVQTRGSTSAFIPRFRPSDGPQWSGTLTRFELYNEFTAGCTAANYGTDGGLNPNGNRSCADLYLRDRNGKYVGENANGDFVELDTSQPYGTNGWPIKTKADGGDYPATPIWEASANLTARTEALLGAADGGAATTQTARRIFTVAPSGSVGSYGTGLVDFTFANRANITPLLRLGGYQGELCTTLGALTRHTYTSDDDCTADVIRFMHGENVLSQLQVLADGGSVTPRARPKILGDIFHSTPVLVTPPAATFLCDTGLINQCVPSLYSTTLTPGGVAAYNSYASTWAQRQQFVLVAANDGMLHAFNAGNYQAATTDGGVSSFDLGTGDELWAFIPPDMLPKLIRYIIGERHELLVDGTPMVRDIWADGSGSTTTKDNLKQADEFHTVAIVGKREGGRGYFALDVTDPTSPRFLWSSPTPGTTESLEMGESWNDLGPGAAPIGPIAQAYTGTGTAPFSVGTTPAIERYIVAVGGGFDPAYLRGRSVHMLDAWTGAQVYRFARSDAGAGTDEVRQRLMPVAAPPSLVDSDQDGLFDLAVVGDTGGQIWVMNLKAPGTPNTAGLYTNWYGARAFVQLKGSSYSQRSPFFQRAVVASLPSGELRILVGSGNRDQIKDPNGGSCGLANLTACIRKGCSVSVQATKYRFGSSPTGGTSGHYATGSWSLDAGSTDVPSGSFSKDSASSPSASCSDVVDVNINYGITCSTTLDGGSATYAAPAYCDWGGTDGGVQCPVDTGRPLGTKVETVANTVTKTRFYSLKLFDTTGNRARFTTATQAKTYDDYALSDSTLKNAASQVSSASDDGWYLDHSNANTASYVGDERTASSALLLGGCVLWNTLVPNANTTIACGQTTLPPDTAYIYQADAITGAISCGTAGGSTYTATARSVQRTTYIAPQQPAPVISVNANTGEILYSGVSIEPGAPPMSVSVGAGDLMGPIHWLEVPRNVHDCRHNGTNCN
ncbi:hypothetical protein FGE12_10450 [Aggregicoccus sp. 17bor-14]|uniref:pilus assembly protein n=1 Tax=Myxococcaceae TaxID=31 RepID=UPI00129CDBAF|nr:MULTISPECIES: PilC/PilY family type IV pilus protein [Myxococcaceae]MBF5042813.1 hypothetical protein [Simulacricoccus sp. 17bor-14]MRI88581.1 hypothetical protein [Aggregicoccus sp. 17bor-14]